ncbi:MAG: hypothetical protein K0Q76_1043 [Panacagrimonas sp.]|jgi:hypothetical protein|nr:hypothetical protein [Panacagrimonas sp.]MCC2655935.1 hypothetical protein [Panacagrimonas sp.]
MTKIQTTGAIVALALLATGCSGIGDGSKLESIRIAQDLRKEEGEETQVKAFTCLAAPLVLVGKFSKGDVGDFSYRAHWTSDDESVVKVANYRDPVEGKEGQFYLRGGVLLPQDTAVERTTTIHAEYLGFTASMEVVVKPSTNLRIIPSVARIIPDSAQKFLVRGEIDGIDTDVTSLSDLTFVEEDADAVATVGEEAQLQLVRGVAVGGPVTLRPQFDAPCPSAPTAQVFVSAIPPNGLVLDYEEGYTDQIAERTSEALRLKVVFGDFNDDGDTEDPGEFMRLDTLDSQGNTLYGYDRDDDGQCELLLEDRSTTEDPNPPTALTFGSLIAGLNLMNAVADEDTTDRTTKICASFGGKSDPDGEGPLLADNGTLSNVLPVTVRDVTLPPDGITLAVSDPCDPETSISNCEPLDPAPDPTAPEVDEGTILRIRAQGAFTGGYTQDITKNVIFTSNTPKLAAVGAGGVLVTASDISVVKSTDCLETATSCTAKIKATWTQPSTSTEADATEELTITVRAVPDDD